MSQKSVGGLKVRSERGKTNTEYLKGGRSRLWKEGEGRTYGKDQKHLSPRGGLVKHDGETGVGGVKNRRIFHR